MCSFTTILTYRQYDSSVLLPLVHQTTKIYIKYMKLYLANKANKQSNTSCVCNSKIEAIYV